MMRRGSERWGLVNLSRFTCFPNLATMIVGLSVACTGSAATTHDLQGEPDVLVIASRLRQVKIVYTENGSYLGQCDVKAGKDARIIDQMMCSLLASCIADGWGGLDRATKCINARVDELETRAVQGRFAPASSPFPDEWLAAGYEPKKGDTGNDVMVHLPEAAIEAGSWVFTEMGLGRGSNGRTAPYVLRWKTCLPPDCRRWNVKVQGRALSGSMACRTAAGASAAGSLKGSVTRNHITLHRERSWRKLGAWSEATFDTSATREGACRG